MSDRLTITDSKGRKFEYQQLDATEMLDLYEAAGGALCANGAWLGTALLCCSVRNIDGTPVPMPRDKKGIKTLVGKIELQGQAAIREALAEADAAEDAGEADDNAKEVASF